MPYKNQNKCSANFDNTGVIVDDDKEDENNDDNSAQKCTSSIDSKIPGYSFNTLFLSKSHW